jgi:hypothetical protein
MKTILLIILALTVIPIIDISFAEELEIEFGKTISYENLKLYFYDIEDSRCPSDVTCVWEGKVSAMIRVSNGTLDIGGPQPIGFVQKSFQPYLIILKDIQPYPVSTEKPDYVATLDIIKSEPRPTDFRETNEENGLVIIIIQSSGAGLIVLFITIYAIKKRKK